MKKKKPELIEWQDLKVGDFVESNSNRLFCFMVDSKFNSPSCMGKNKKEAIRYSNVLIGRSEYTRMKPTKAFIKTCKQLLDLNLKEYHLDNLSYIEALAALKKYD